MGREGQDDGRTSVQRGGAEGRQPDSHAGVGGTLRSSLTGVSYQSYAKPLPLEKLPDAEKPRKRPAWERERADIRRAYWANINGLSIIKPTPHIMDTGDVALPMLRDAADECEHGRLPGDKAPPCGCWAGEKG
jgi:hypothetical protein